MTRARFDIHMDSTVTGVVRAAECAIEEVAGLVRRVDFRYTRQYLENPNAFPLDPNRLHLDHGETQFACAGGVPGFIDDHLPDAWGRKVLAVLAQQRDGKRLNQNSAIDLLTVVPAGSRIGALSFAPPGDTPRFDHGAPFAALAEAERAAVHVDALDSVGPDEWGLARLAAAGSSVGGARPKALVTDGDTHYLAKFNRLSDDPYNNARVELACLEMARAGWTRRGAGQGRRRRQRPRRAASPTLRHRSRRASTSPCDRQCTPQGRVHPARFGIAFPLRRYRRSALPVFGRHQGGPRAIGAAGALQPGDQQHRRPWSELQPA